MTDFKAKMHQIRFRLGLRPRPRWGTYSAPPDPLLDLDAALRQGEGLGWGRGEKEGGEGEGGRAPKLLLNQGTKFDLGWGSAPDPAGELTALPQTP